MENQNRLFSITADSSLMEDNLKALLEVLPNNIPDELFSMIIDLADNIVLVNSTTTIRAGSTFNLISVFDFNFAVYDKVISTARAFKANGAH